MESIGAVSGVGIASGTGEVHQYSYPVTNEIDTTSSANTSQRAYLLASITGLEIFSARYLAKSPQGTCDSEGKRWIFASISEYVVKGMTEWLPSGRHVVCIIGACFGSSRAPPI